MSNVQSPERPKVQKVEEYRKISFYTLLGFQKTKEPEVKRVSDSPTDSASVRRMDLSKLFSKGEGDRGGY